MTSMLLKGGTLLLHDDSNHVIPTVADLLIEGNLITKIAPDIPVPPSSANTKVIGCAFKIISPGFVSTHAHLWQSQLKGLHANHTLVDYMPSGAYGSIFFTSSSSSSSSSSSVASARGGDPPGRHIFWGELAGALESLDAGTTTVVDHSHCNVSGGGEARAALAALRLSGIRGVYCYQPPRRATSFDPFVTEDKGPLDEDVKREFEGLIDALKQREGPRGGGGEGRVAMGFALDSLFLPTETLRAVYAYLRGEDREGEEGERERRRAKLITSHSTGGPAFGGRPYAVSILDRAGVLGPDVLLSHANGLAEQDVAALRRAGAFVSSTPNTEMQMGVEPVSMWRSVLGDDGGSGASSSSTTLGSLGVDCHTWGTSYLPTQMNLILQQRRLSRAMEVAQGITTTTSTTAATTTPSSSEDKKNKKERWVRHVEGDPEQAFNLGTVAGAQAAGLSDQVGRLREGFKADVVVFSGTSPGMLGAAQQDPVAAVVLHSSVRDVETVIVDGVVRKEGGRLCDVVVDDDEDDKENPLAVDRMLLLSSPSGGEEGNNNNKKKDSTVISWEDVVRELGKSREEILGRMEGVDFGPAAEAMIDAWHMDRSTMAEK